MFVLLEILFFVLTPDIKINNIDIENDLCECNVQYAVELFELNETERSQRQEADTLLQTQVEELKEALTAQMTQIAVEKANREAVEAALKRQNGQLFGTSIIPIIFK